MAAYIYGLRDPRTLQIRYVGKTTDLRRRLREHLSHAENRGLVDWIGGLRRRGQKPELAVIQLVSEDKWQEAERFWIRKLKEAGVRLLNGSPGGMGGSNKGHHISPEGRARIDAGIRRACKGKKLSPERCRQISESKRGTTHTLETRRKMSKAHSGVRHHYYGKHLSAEHRAKISASKKGRPGTKHTQETRRRMSEIHSRLVVAARPYPSLRNEHTGEVIPAGHNLCAMCRERGLNRPSIQKVVAGKRRSCFGWVINDEPIDTGGLT